MYIIGRQTVKMSDCKNAEGTGIFVRDCTSIRLSRIKFREISS